MIRILRVAAAVDSTGLCLFTAFAVIDMPEAFDALCQMINALHGLNIGGDDVTALGKSVLSMERKWNQEAGFTKADDRLPRWMRTEPLAPHNTVFAVTDEELDTVFDFVK